MWWMLAELLSLVGLFLVPAPLVTQIILVAWNLAADGLLALEACFILNWLGFDKIGPVRFKRIRLRRFWTEQVRRDWYKKKYSKHSAHPTPLELAVVRENNQYEAEYEGAQCRRSAQPRVTFILPI